MVSTNSVSDIAPRLLAAPQPRSPSPPPSPFAAVSDKPHTSISSLPGLPAPFKSTAQRRRSETQELKTKVELLGTKVRIAM